MRASANMVYKAHRPVGQLHSATKYNDNDKVLVQQSNNIMT